MLKIIITTIMIICSHPIRCHEYFIQEAEPFEDEDGPLCFGDLGQSIFIEEQTVSQLHGEDL